jgi:hypothetical protein
MIQPPVAVNLTVCEQLIVEEKTHKITLVNCFARLTVRQVPSPPQRLVIYARLTGGRGDGKITLEILHPSTLEPILEQEKTAFFSHPFQEINAIFRGLLSLSAAGRYQVNLLVDGSIIAQRTLEVFVEEESSS